MIPQRPVGTQRSARWRVARGVGAALAVFALALGGWLGGPKAPSAAARLLERLPADPRCGHPLGQLASLARGEALPADACLGELATTPMAAPLLEHLARDVRRPWPARASAAAALVAGGQATPGLLEALVVAPKPAPGLRRAVWALAEEQDPEWIARAEQVAAHGLYDRAAGRRFAEGEPGSATGAARALAASAGPPDPGLLDDVYRGLGTNRERLAEGVRRSAAGQMPLGFPPEWTNPLRRNRCEGPCVPLLVELLRVEADRGGEEPGPSAAAVPGADAAIDALYTDGERADHLREELAAVAAWIGRTGEPWRAARLVSAVLHPEATPPAAAESLAEAGDPHAVLVRGAGTPGATALAATDLALATRVPLTAWTTGGGVALQVAGQLYRVDACAAARPVGSVEADWRAVPTGGVDALALVEGAARALREREVLSARTQVDAARRAWDAAPGLAAVEAAVLAAESGGAPYGPTPGAAPPGTSPATVTTNGAATPPTVSAANPGGPVPEATPAAPPPAWQGLVGVSGPGTLFVSRPTFPPPRATRRRGAAPPPVDLRPLARAALLERLDRIRALAPDPEDRVRAAWWAADAGDLELARRLLATAPGEPGPPSALGRTLRTAVLRAAGEPGAARPAPTAPESAAAAEPRPCPSPHRADPPLSAWDGAPPPAD